MIFDYWDKKNNSFTLVLPEDMDSVKIMTVHKAKGLEFKVVIYPYAFTSFPDAGITNEESWVDVKDYIPEMEDCLLPLNKEVLKNTEFEKLYDEEYAKTILDDMNIMYVAMTRAEEMLLSIHMIIKIAIFLINCLVVPLKMASSFLPVKINWSLKLKTVMEIRNTIVVNTSR